MHWTSGIIGGLAGLFVASCSITDHPVLSKVRNEQLFAMIGQEHRTDGNIIDIFDYTNTIIIKSGKGGELQGMLETLEFLDEHPEKTIVIDGECASSCTLLLSRPQNVVFTEHASFLFHSAYVKECRNGFQHFDRRQIGNDQMLNVFPQNLREWINKSHAFESVDFTRLDSLSARFYFPQMYVNSSSIPDMTQTNGVHVITNRIRMKVSLKSC